MTVQEYLSFLTKLVDAFPLTLFDILILFSLFIYAAAERKRGIIKTCLVLGGVLLDYIVTIFVYPFLSHFFWMGIFSKGVSDAISIILCAAVFGLVLLVIYGFILANISDELKSKTTPILEAIMNIPIFLVTVAGIVIIFLSFPVEGFIKHSISNSVIMPNFVRASLSVDATFHRLQGQPVSDLLLFHTISPEKTDQEEFSSTGSVLLSATESQALSKALQKQRSVHFASILNTSLALSQLSDAIAISLGNDRVLSRTTFRNNTLFDLLEFANIPYSDAAVFVARAPSASIALTGLMLDPQYKESLLSSSYSSFATSAVTIGNEANLYVLIFIR